MKKITKSLLRILKVLGIGVCAFVGLMLLFWGMETVFGHDTTSHISGDFGNLVTIFVVVAVIIIVVNKFKKKKTTEVNLEKIPQKTISEQASDLKNLYFASYGLACNIAADDNKTMEERIKFLRNAVMHKEPKLVESKSLDKLRTDLEKMETDYNRLVEKDKNDLKKIVELNKDLRDYFLALHGLKMAWCILEMDMSHEATDNYGKLQDEYIPKKEEIEKKFNDLLNHQKNL